MEPTENAFPSSYAHAYVGRQAQIFLNPWIAQRLHSLEIGHEWSLHIT